jgi:hypothetical protein
MLSFHVGQEIGFIPESAVKRLSPNKRVKADAVRQRTVFCCFGGRAAHAQR